MAFNTNSVVGAHMHDNQRLQQIVQKRNTSQFRPSKNQLMN